jgi:PAS domain S-box-containing protein
MARDTSNSAFHPLFLLALAVLALYASSLHSYLLFHSLVEVSNVVIAFTVFALAWNARTLLDNHYILFIGISCLFSAAFELIHLFAYKGFGMFPRYDSNLPTQLWIASRYMFSLSYVIAPVFLARRMNVTLVLAVFSGVTALLFATIFSGQFPDCFVEGQGLTLFKTASEFVIIFLLIVALVVLLKKHGYFDAQVLKLLACSIVSAIAADCAFIHYLNVYGQANLIGHLFLFVSAAMIYQAIVVTGMREPMAVIFRNLEQSEERLKSIAQTSDDLIFQLDLEGTIVFCSPAVLQYGFKVNEVVGRNFLPFLAEESHESAQAAFEQALKGEHIQGLELSLLTAEGISYCAEINVAPIRFREAVVGLQGISRDISTRKEDEKRLRTIAAELQTANTALLASRTAALNLMQDAVEAHAHAKRTNEELLREMVVRLEAEEQIKSTLAEKDVMLREIHHRVKNNLQIISSLVSLQADGLEDERLRAVFGDVRDRIRTMALVHEKLYQTGDLARLNFADYAVSLLQFLWRSHGALADKVRYAITVDPVTMPIVTAVPCGLILNELVGNTLKHAFPDGRSGEVSVSLQYDPASATACLRVRDDGVGLPAGLDWRNTQSFGLHLVQLLAGQLDAEVACSTGSGTEFAVTFSLSGGQT